MSKVLDKLAMILALKGGNGGDSSGGGGGTLIVDYTIAEDEQSDNGYTVTNHSHTAQEISDAIGEGKTVIARVVVAGESEYSFYPLSRYYEYHDDEEDTISVCYDIAPKMMIVDNSNGSHITFASAGGSVEHSSGEGEEYCAYSFVDTRQISSKYLTSYDDSTQQLGRSFQDIASMIQGVPCVIVFGDYKTADIVAVDYDNSLTDPYIVIDGLGNRYYAHTIWNNPVKSS